MRLTLRTLLAYLDDTLDPEQARDIGRKVAQSDVAQELIDRIKTVTRRRRLKAPPVASDDPVLDPNTIAEYLDNVLPAEELVQLEESAQTSDPLLAEIAACHQVLTLILGEPAKVPPTARQRMYRLVKGRESIPYRKPAVAAVAGVAEPAPVSDRSEGDETLLLGLPAFSRDESFSRRLIPIGGVLFLVLALIVCIWVAVPSRSPVHTPGTYVAAVTPKAEPAPKPESGKKVAPAPKTKNGEVPPKPERGGELGPEPRVVNNDAEAKKVEAPPKKEPLVPPVAKPAPERVALGTLAPKQTLVVHQPDMDDWTKPAGETPKIFSTDILVALPGYHPEVQLDSGLRLQLWGTLPGEFNAPLLESRLSLFEPMRGLDMDFRLDEGRVFITAPNVKADMAAKVRLRFKSEVWDITLHDAQTEVGIDLVGYYPPGVPFSKKPGGEAPTAMLQLAVLKGKASVELGFKKFANIQAPASIGWDNKGAGVTNPHKIDEKALDFWSRIPPKKVGPARVEIDGALEDFSRRLNEHGVAPEVIFSSAVIGRDERMSRREMGTLFMAAIGAISPLTDELSDEQVPVREMAMVGLRHWISQSPERDLQLYQLLMDRKRLPEEHAEQLMALLHSFSPEQANDPETFATLFLLLNHERLAIRALAFLHLQGLDPTGANESQYDPAAPMEYRNASIDKWKLSLKRRMDKKK